MTLSEIITVTLDDLESTDKNDVIREMIDGLIAAGQIDADSREKVIRAVREREKTGSTGIGNGIGVPHARHDSLDKLVGAFARSTGGIQFDALDGEPVYLVFMLLSSKALTSQHLDALKCISRFHREEKYCKFLRHAKDKTEIRELFKEVDEDLAE